MEIINPSALSKGVVKATNPKIVKFVVVKYTQTHYVLAVKRRSKYFKNEYVYNIATLDGIPVTSIYSHYIEEVCEKHNLSCA